MRLEFVECEKCSAESGSTYLCESCLHNREVIEKLKMRIRRLEGFVSLIKRTIELM